ncbi:MAG TPA: RNA-binding cell elongation regulator Jag/EloR [Symbiobacteriaceae bacterium]|nr:RNA-binding cell elongation regulator Jag/EloR [Symbiobacteriaceae bacterium]
MRSVEKQGRTVDEALAAALDALGVPSDRVKVEVLDEGKGGFLGIGAKPAIVRVTLKESRKERVEQFLGDVCDAMEVDVNVTVHSEGEYLHADIGGREAGILIGHHGQTLDAMQYLLNLVVSKVEDDSQRVVLDVEGYRKRREETLVRLATRLAERVKRNGEPMVLEPMTAQERRVIHLALQDNPHVVTGSEGEDPFRRVVIQVRK